MLKKLEQKKNQLEKELEIIVNRLKILKDNRGNYLDIIKTSLTEIPDLKAEIYSIKGRLELLDEIIKEVKNEI